MPGTVLVTGVLLTAINSYPTVVSRLGSVGNIARNIGRAALGATAVGTATLAYAAGIERSYLATEEGFASARDLLVVIAGIPFAQAGTTNNLRVVTVEEKSSST